MKKKFTYLLLVMMIILSNIVPTAVMAKESSDIIKNKDIINFVDSSKEKLEEKDAASKNKLEEKKAASKNKLEEKKNASKEKLEEKDAVSKGKPSEKAENIKLIGENRESSEKALYIKRQGNDENDGLSYEKALKTLEKAIEIAKSDNFIKTIYICNSLEIEGTVSLSGTDAVIKRHPNYAAYLFSVSKGKIATLENVTIDGNSENASLVSNSLINVEEDATLNIQKGTVLQNNHFGPTGSDAQTFAGGAIFSRGTINMTGGVIQNNEANRGGAICLYSPSTPRDYMQGNFKNSIMNFSGGVIKNNKAKDYAKVQSGTGFTSGGGISLMDGSILNMSGSAEVSGNSSDNAGGGISVGDLRGTLFDITFNMTGGKIKNNTSKGGGAGLFVQAGQDVSDEVLGLVFHNTANISGGEITYNKTFGIKGNTMFGGGGIYVNGANHYQFTNGVLNLKNAVIRENKAMVSGAGYAACPCSYSTVYLKNGVAIFNNQTESRKAADIYLVGGYFNDRHHGYSPHSISPIMLGGKPYNWKLDDGSEIDINQLTGELEYDESLSLHTDVKESTEAEKSKKVLIAYNESATSGAGIGSNGTVNMGEKDITEVKVTKKWDDKDKKNRPKEVKVFLYRKLKTNEKEELVGSQIIKGDTWKASFKNLPKTDNSGEDIIYTVKEDKVKGYTSTVKEIKKYEFTITNKETPPTRDIKATKDWLNSNGSKLTAPVDEIEVELYRDGKATGKTLKLNKTNNWTGEFKKLPAYESINKTTPYEYSIKEVGESGSSIKFDGKWFKVEYKGSVKDGFTVINKETPPWTPMIPPTRDIKVTKDWLNSNGSKLTAPVDEIEVELYRDGKATGKTLKLNKTNNWTGEFKKLPAYESINKTTPYEYSIKEVGESGSSIKFDGKWFKVEYKGSMKDGFRIVNKEVPDDPYTPPNIPEKPANPRSKIRVSKEWKDSKNNLIEAPIRSIEVELYKDGKATGIRAILNNNNNWSSTFDNIIIFKKDVYTIKEIGEVNGIISFDGDEYKVEYKGGLENGFKIVNIKNTNDKPRKPVDKPKDDPKLPAEKPKNTPKTPPANPNTTPKTPSTKLNLLPKTGDGFNRSTYARLLAVAGVILLIVGKKKKGKFFR